LGKNPAATPFLVTPAQAGVQASMARADIGWYDIAIA
jgi:hypothetical protein